MESTVIQNYASARCDQARQRQQLRLGGALIDEISDELRAVRAAVDGEARGRGGTPTTALAMRLEPRRPTGVREYHDVCAFVTEDPRRALPDWPSRRDAGGADYGFDWTLEHPIRRWETTRWRVSHLEEETGEIYAVEFTNQGGRTEPGRVWLFGAMSAKDVQKTIRDLRLPVRPPRNSFALVAQELACRAQSPAAGPLS